MGSSLLVSIISVIQRVEKQLFFRKMHLEKILHLYENK